METLTRRINSTFGTLASLKGRHNNHHHRLNSSMSIPADDILNSPPCLLTPDSTAAAAISRMDFGAAAAASASTSTGSSVFHVTANPSASSGKSGSGHMRSASGTSTQSGMAAASGVGAASLSVSMNSVSSEGSNEGQLVEQEVVALTHDVRAFKEALSRLRRILHPDKDKLDNLRVAAHERLGEVLRILRAILEKYPPLQSTELLMAAGHLIQQVKDCSYEDDKCNPAEFFESIDQLALAFSSRVSEYLMGDIDTSTTLRPTSRTRSCEHLIPDSKSENFESSPAKDINGEPGTLTAEEIDEVLMKLDCGVNLALHRAKVWSKYAKDVMNYVEKRATLEAEHSRSLEKLAQNVKAVFKEEVSSFLPFQSIYGTALDQDVENANFCQATCTLLKEHKFVEPLSSRRSEHEKHRKQIKETWQRECKRTQEAIGNLRKARSQYIQRNLDYEKAKESVLKVENSDTNEISKLDKKKRLEEDALQKVADAESLYKACVDVANERHHVLENTKATVLKQVRELMLQCDQTLKAVTVCYFQLQHTITAQAPVQFQTLCESSRLYEPGSQYLEFVKKLPISVPAIDTSADPFSFEAFSSYNRMPDRDRKSVVSCETLDESGTLPHKLTAERREKMRSHHVVMSAKVWGPAAVTAVLGSDSDSIGSSQSNKSQDTSPTASPQGPVRRMMSHGSSGDELDIDGDLMVDNGYGAMYRRTCLSKAAATHTFRKLKTLAKCRECDTYVYFQGLECCQCGLASHKKCLEFLAIQCGHKRLPRRMTTFGVDLGSHLHEAQTNVPHLVLKCVSEVDRRGCQIKGIYRVSGVKSRVEKLCQSFENGANLVDLSDVHPNVIANVLKLYLRQLPEPLLTFNLYPDFIRIAKETQCKSNDIGNRDRNVLNDLKETVKRLPASHRSTLACLMHHLHRVAKCSSENNMPSSNLGIVFGPTLLRSSEGASLTSLVDTVHQAKAVELLITNVDEVFGEDVSLQPICTNGRSQSIGSDVSDRRKQSNGEEPEYLLPQAKVQSAQLVTKSCTVNAQSPDDDSRTSNSFDDPTSKVISCESSSAKVVSNTAVAQSRNSSVRINSSELPSGLSNVSDTIITKPPSVACDATSTTVSARNSERTKPFSTTSGVATQTDLSFLRNLTSSSPSARKQAYGNNNNNNNNNASNDVTSNHDKVNLSGAKESLTADRIVIHVAGPKEQSDVLDSQTSNGHEVPTSASDALPKGKSPRATLKQCREAETSAPTSLEFLLEGDPECGADKSNAKKSDGVDKTSDDRTENNHLRLGSSHNQLDQDSGFEDAKTSPNSSPSHYVSPYLSNYPYWPYRWTTGAPLATYATMKPTKVTDPASPTLPSPSEVSSVSTATLSLATKPDSNGLPEKHSAEDNCLPPVDATGNAMADGASKSGIDAAACDDRVFSDRVPHFV